MSELFRPETQDAAARWRNGPEPRDSDALHEQLQEHVSKCDQCRQALDRNTPRAFGHRTLMCDEYSRIIELYAPPYKTMHDFGGWIGYDAE